MAQLSTPNGITFDICGNLYIAEGGRVSVSDSGHNIRKVSLNPSCRPEALPIESDAISNDCIIYPNPVLQTINLLSKTCFTQISIENYLCQTLFTQTYTTTKAEIDMCGYPAGVYIVRVRDKDGGQIVRKVVKE